MSDQQQPPTTHTTVIQPSGGMVSVASDTVGALKSTPVLLVLVLLNCTFIGAAAYYFRIQQENVSRLVDKILTRCLPDGRHSEADISRPPARVYTPTPDSYGYKASPLDDVTLER